MAMRWRVSASDWQPNQQRLLNRDGAKIVDKQEDRRRLTAYELNGMIGAKASWELLNYLVKDLESQLRHVGAWGRMKAALAQIRNIIWLMMEKTSLEQIVSIKNNTQHVRLSMTPEMLPGETEMTIQPVREHTRLLCASLAYCEMHCDGSQLCQRGCKIKAMLDDSLYIADCKFPEEFGGVCKYSMPDVAWDKVRKGG